MFESQKSSTFKVSFGKCYNFGTVRYPRLMICSPSNRRLIRQFVGHVCGRIAPIQTSVILWL